MDRLFLFADAVERDPAIEAWFSDHQGVLGRLAGHWFDVLRASGPEVRELIHNGHPTACVQQAAFAYVNAFKAHVNVGFFKGAELPDPDGLLVGSGKFMRHVKLRPDEQVDEHALKRLIEAAYVDMKQRLQAD